MTLRTEFFSTKGKDEEFVSLRRLRLLAQNQTTGISYSEIEDRAAEVVSVESAWSWLVRAISKVGMTQVIRVVLSRPDDGMFVVKVIVPKLEAFEPQLKRVGPRLIKHV